MHSRSAFPRCFSLDECCFLRYNNSRNRTMRGWRDTQVLPGGDYVIHGIQRRLNGNRRLSRDR